MTYKVLLIPFRKVPHKAIIYCLNPLSEFFITQKVFEIKHYFLTKTWKEKELYCFTEHALEPERDREKDKTVFNAREDILLEISKEFRVNHKHFNFSYEIYPADFEVLE